MVGLCVRCVLMMCAKMTGELLDQIEYQVKGAAQYVEDGTLQVQGAIQHAKKARKYQCCMLICTLVAVGVLVLVLFVFKVRAFLRRGSHRPEGEGDGDGSTWAGLVCV